MRPRVLAAAALAVTMGAAPALAEDRLLFLGGEADSRNYYLYTGTVLPMPGYSLGAGLVQRYWLDLYTYDYLKDSARIDADAIGFEAALGYQWSGPDWWSGVYAGVRVTDISLSPDDPTADARGTQAGFKLQAEAEAPLAGAWRVQGIAAYATGTDGYWVRGRLMRPVLNGLVAGPEAVALGNDDFSAWQAGVFLGNIALAPHTHLLVKAGYRHQDGSGRAYGGLELISRY